MESDTILSISAPFEARTGVRVLAAPVLELVYAHYHLLHHLDDGRPSPLAWLRELRERRPGWLDALLALCGEPSERAGHGVFLLACGLGYATDDDPRRFLDDLPSLPTRLLEQLDALAPTPRADDPEARAKGERLTAEIRATLERMARPAFGTELQPLLRELWGTLGPDWERQGRAAAQAAAAAFRKELASTGDLMQALPRHHFTQFEAHATELRELQRRGQLVVTPLSFASVGGFHLEVHDTVYLGFGLHGESAFAEQADELRTLAGQLKAFADPTRLQLLALIARFGSFPLTVGDLARQLGVSQPTVSGHLKLLRSAGLVTLEKRGNRSYYHADSAAVGALLRSLGDALLS